MRMGAGGGGWGAQVNVRISVEGVSRRRTMRAVFPITEEPPTVESCKERLSTVTGRFFYFHLESWRGRNL